MTFLEIVSQIKTVFFMIGCRGRIAAVNAAIKRKSDKGYSAVHVKCKTKIEKTVFGLAIWLWVRVTNLMRADHVVCVMKVTLWRRAILVSAIMDTEDPAAGVGHFFPFNQFWNFLKIYYENQTISFLPFKKDMKTWFWKLLGLVAPTVDKLKFYAHYDVLEKVPLF